MNPKRFLLLPLVLGCGVVSGQPAPLDAAAQEDRVAQAEARLPRKFPTGAIRGEYWATPWLAYFEAFDKTRAAANANAAATGGAVGAVPRSNLLDVAWAGAMTASWNVTPRGAAAHNWTYAAGGLLLLDLLTSNTSNNLKVSAHEKVRMLTLTTPSIHFVQRVPGAFANGGNGYDTIRASSAVIEAVGLQCTPALFHAPAETTMFVGGASPGQSYFRKFVCGFGPGETISEKTAGSEVSLLSLTAYTDSPPLLRFSLTNLPTMAHLRAVLGTTDDAQMGRAAYERVREHVPAEWTVVFSAPNEAGAWTVYVARNGIVDAFEPPPKSAQP